MTASASGPTTGGTFPRGTTGSAPPSRALPARPAAGDRLEADAYMALDTTGDERGLVEAGASSITEECRRLGELLALDAVGVVLDDTGERRTSWWAAPDVALPERVETVLEGRAAGWIACPLPGQASIVARLTKRSPIRTPEVLSDVGPALVAAARAAGLPAVISLLPPSAEPSDDLIRVIPPGETRSPVERALGELRDDLGFETASLFVPGTGGWKLLARLGDERPWHALLDPETIVSTDQAEEHRDVRTLPGVGSRLADLGCASVAVLPVPDGGRVVLDSSSPSSTDGWIERARSYLALISIMAGPTWGSSGSLRGHQEIGTLNRVFSACQEVLDRPNARIELVVDAVREALGADELFLLSMRDGGMEVMSSPADTWPRRLPREAAAKVMESSSGAIEPDALRHVAMALGASSPTLVAGSGRELPAEMLLGGWREGPAPTDVSMAVVARTVSTARVALQGRQQAVTTLVDRERNRMAYALHDGLTQTVTAALLQLDTLGSRIETDPHGAVSILDSTKTEIRRALSELRSILFDLSNGAREERRPEILTHNVEDVVKRWRLPARVTVEGDLNAVPARILAVAYVVIREALANAAKHAAASNVSVNLAVGDTDFAVTIGDAGRGFSPREQEAARGSNHMGLEMLRRRVHEVGGQFEVESRPGKGTRVVARLPMREVAT